MWGAVVLTVAVGRFAIFIQGGLNINGWIQGARPASNLQAALRGLPAERGGWRHRQSGPHDPKLTLETTLLHRDSTLILLGLTLVRAALNAGLLLLTVLLVLRHEL
jgi:hypothetical protein